MGRQSAKGNPWAARERKISFCNGDDGWIFAAHHSFLPGECFVGIFVRWIFGASFLGESRGNPPQSPQQNSIRIWELRGQNPHCKGTRLWQVANMFACRICLMRSIQVPRSCFPSLIPGRYWHQNIKECQHFEVLIFSKF